MFCCAVCFVLLFLESFCQVKSTGLSFRLKKATSHCEPTTCGFEEKHGQYRNPKVCAKEIAALALIVLCKF